MCLSCSESCFCHQKNFFLIAMKWMLLMACAVGRFHDLQTWNCKSLLGLNENNKPPRATNGCTVLRFAVSEAAALFVLKFHGLYSGVFLLFIVGRYSTVKRKKWITFFRVLLHNSSAQRSLRESGRKWLGQMWRSFSQAKSQTEV